MSGNIVCAADERSSEKLGVLARRLALPLVSAADLRPDQDWSHVLFYNGDKLSIRSNTLRPPSPTCVDFSDPALQYRRQTMGRAQGLGSAVGLKKLREPLLVDATAGLGRDAFMLAAMGCEVIMLERSPLIHALLADGLARAMAFDDPDLAAVAGRMELHLADAACWFEDRHHGSLPGPDVIYLDPMFPARGKSARVKKDIALLQELLGVDEDFEKILQSGLSLARHRVVVKRPGRKTASGAVYPDYQVPGSSCHFDIYLARR